MDSSSCVFMTAVLSFFIRESVGAASVRAAPYVRPLVLVARASGAARHDLVAGGRNHPPLRSEVIEALAAGQAFPRVPRELVERVVAVGDLPAAVRPAGRAE